MNKTYLRKVILLFPAVLLLACGISFCTSAGLGADLHTSFLQGIGRQIHLSPGTMTLLFNLLLLFIYFFAQRSWIGPGSLLIGFCLGPFMNLFESLFYAKVIVLPLPLRILIDIFGIFLISLALSFYIPLNVGLQPLDMLKQTMANTLKLTYGNATNLYSVIALAGTLLFGGDVGIGSILTLLLCGKMCDLLLPHTQSFIEKMNNEKIS